MIDPRAGMKEDENEMDRDEQRDVKVVEVDGIRPIVLGRLI